MNELKYSLVFIHTSKTTHFFHGVIFQGLQLTSFIFFQVIELDLGQLPEGEEVLTILRQEQAPMHCWVNLAVCYVVLYTSIA